MRLSHTCPSCGTYMSASDQMTLDWGVRTHSCNARSLVDSGEETQKARVLCLLAGIHKGPFMFMDAEGGKVLVT